MDSVTQAVLGAAVGTAVMGRTRPVWQAALAGAVLGTLPDLDVFFDKGDPIRDMKRAQRMLEPRVDGGRIDQARAPELFDPAQALKAWRVDQGELFRPQLDVAVNGVANDLRHTRSRPRRGSQRLCAGS